MERIMMPVWRLRVLWCLAVGLPALASAADEDPLAASDYREPEVCVKVSDIAMSRAVDADTIVLKMEGGTYRRVDLKNRCSLQYGTGVALANEPGRRDAMCTLSRIRPRGSGGTTCLIERIVEITPEEGKYLQSKEYRARRSSTAER
jgi:hypothetical protein